MKWYQFPIEKQCHVHITNGLIIYDLSKPLALNPTQTRRISAAWRLCVRSRCGGAGGGGLVGAEGSPGITAELRDKRDIVAQTDPSKKT